MSRGPRDGYVLLALALVATLVGAALVLALHDPPAPRVIPKSQEGTADRGASLLRVPCAGTACVAPWASPHS